MSSDLQITIWRDSVCAGDDADAPHEVRLVLPREVSVGSLADRIIERRYLASVAGDRATWILNGRRPLAVFAQQWLQPRFLISPESLLAPLIDLTTSPHLQFRYWCQVDPDRVFDCLLHGKPLPDKYGRGDIG